MPLAYAVHRCDGSVVVKVRGAEILHLARCLAGMLKLRGLPFSCTKADIMEWFTDLPVAPIPSDGCATGFLGCCLWRVFPGQGSPDQCSDHLVASVPSGMPLCNSAREFCRTVKASFGMTSWLGDYLQGADSHQCRRAAVRHGLRRVCQPRGRRHSHGQGECRTSNRLAVPVGTAGCAVQSAHASRNRRTACAAAWNACQNMLRSVDGVLRGCTTGPQDAGQSVCGAVSVQSRGGHHGQEWAAVMDGDGPTGWSHSDTAKRYNMELEALVLARCLGRPCLRSLLQLVAPISVRQLAWQHPSSNIGGTWPLLVAYGSAARRRCQHHSAVWQRVCKELMQASCAVRSRKPSGSHSRAGNHPSRLWPAALPMAVACRACEPSVLAQIP
jgi:hypothetical protein